MNIALALIGAVAALIVVSDVVVVLVNDDGVSNLFNLFLFDGALAVDILDQRLNLGDYVLSAFSLELSALDLTARGGLLWQRAFTVELRRVAFFFVVGERN